MIKLAQHAHVTREQLQRQYSQQRTELRVQFGDDNQVILVGVQARILFADGDRTCAAYFYFVDAADDEREYDVILMNLQF